MSRYLTENQLAVERVDSVVLFEGIAHRARASGEHMTAPPHRLGDQGENKPFSWLSSVPFSVQSKIQTHWDSAAHTQGIPFALQLNLSGCLYRHSKVCLMLRRPLIQSTW